MVSFVFQNQVIEKCFTGTASRISGVTFNVLAQEVSVWRRGFAQTCDKTGFYACSPEMIMAIDQYICNWQGIFECLSQIVIEIRLMSSMFQNQTENYFWNAFKYDNIFGIV